MVKRFRFNLKEGLPTVIVYALVILALLFISLPILSLFLKTSPDTFISSMENPVVMDALKLSFITSLTTATHCHRRRHADRVHERPIQVPGQGDRGYHHRSPGRHTASRRGHSAAHGFRKDGRGRPVPEHGRDHGRLSPRSRSSWHRHSWPRRSTFDRHAPASRTWTGRWRTRHARSARRN